MYICNDIIITNKKLLNSYADAVPYLIYVLP